MEIVARATVVYFFLWIVARGMGKRELGEMTAFELILLVTMGDLVQQGVTQEDMSIVGAMLAISTMALWILVFSYSSFRWRGTRRLLEGFPVIVLRDGEILDEMLRIERVNVDDFLEAARTQGVNDLRQVEMAVLEPDGRFSFLQRGGGGQEGAPEKHTA